MKKLFSLFTAFALLLLFFAFAPALPVTVSIKKSNFSVGNILVSKNWSVDDFYKALGKPERTRDGYNKTHTYDDLGIVLFEKVTNKIPTGKISEVQFHFKVPEPNEVTPTGQFKGNIKVDKLAVSTSMTPSEMMKKLRKWKKTDSYLSNSYRMSNGIFYIYFQFNESETALIKVSAGKEK